jgi:hypothetical protein
MEEEITADYICTQLELYAILRMCYGQALKVDDLAALAAHKAKYTTALLNGYVANVQTAEDLPGEEQINESSETLRIDTGKQADVTLENYRKLKTYITDAYEKPYHKAKLEAAGSTLYPKAQNENWEQVKGLNTAMKNFIIANETELTANNNMPATFNAKVAADGDDFLTKYNAFMEARKTSLKTAVKIKANNDIYAECMGLMADGKVVFEKNPEKRKYYVFETLKDMVSPPGSASLEVELQYADFTPAVGYIIKIQSEGKPAMSMPTILDTETRGGRAIANFADIDPNPYDWAVYAKEGDRTPVATGRKDVNTGVNAKLKIVLGFTEGTRNVTN